MSEQQTDARDEPEVDRSHLDVEDGCGCAEVWEHLSETREAAAEESE
ncbi:hypothetical protein N0B31_16130 [Salinirubellus salinus]|uniref:Uncharacterized protein n=1 Tax=Salinirubellus salinus TaxID=1364945 RepID=A0A9E7R0Y8_9EURY|nr:hypothetical protein [Salinirubellus salinus]UWM53654.1 hypothetical protein N0B31_16130 [Salinirubellus salinus]